MAGMKPEHQPEPWTQNGRYILDASGWTLASTRFPADARRIVAAINAVQGIPTDALESWVVNVVAESPDLSETVLVYENDRRRGERRHGDRRASRPEISIFGSEAEILESENGEGPR